MAPVCHFIGGCGYRGRDIGRNRAHLCVHGRGSTFDHGEGYDKRRINRLTGNREILDCALGLCRPPRAARHADLAHRIVLDTVLLRIIRTFWGSCKGHRGNLAVITTEAFTRNDAVTSIAQDSPLRMGLQCLCVAG